MSKMNAGLALAVCGALATAPAAARPAPAVPVPLTDTDRAQIQQLSPSYSRALGFCRAEEYVALFASADGYFASGPRGQVAGHDKLVALLKSERHCNDNSERHPRNIPTSMDIQPAPQGAIGQALLGPAGGHYEDEYVKTAQGWRFKSRAYISPQEEAARLTSRDFIEIRRLSGNDAGRFEDVYSVEPSGRQFRSSGTVIRPAAEGAIGKAVLRNDGGRYDDVYVKTPQG
jgi:hypothetical protein